MSDVVDKNLEEKQPQSVSLLSRIRTVLPWLIPIVIVVVALDQYTKYLAENLLQQGELVPVVPGFFNFTLHYNKGAAFGMFHDLPDGVRQLTLWGVSFIAVLAVFYFLLYEYCEHRLGRLSLSLILGGAVGNAIDRATQGKVIDFLDFYIGTYHWPAFNIADSAITVGACVLVLVTLLDSRREQPEVTEA